MWASLETGSSESSAGLKTHRDEEVRRGIQWVGCTLSLKDHMDAAMVQLDHL
jgi:hypothetical protein